MKNIRNFCIIAHIDHGKSTLADRLLEITNTVAKHKMQQRFLDKMDLEREKGITIKLKAVRMKWQDPETKEDHIFNLIDTPGHVDFSYEVSRSLAACEGALLLIDATQGIQAQTLANFYAALEQNLEIIPIVNKIDMPNAEIEKVSKNLCNNFGFREDEVLLTSATQGTGVEKIFPAIVKRIPSPQGNKEEPFRALIFDSSYDQHKGVILYVRVIDGEIEQNDRIKLMASKAETEILELGYLCPQFVPDKKLSAGEVGYIATGLKDLSLCQVGDTIIKMSNVKRQVANVIALPGYKRMKPMVFLGFYPIDPDNFLKLKEALLKMQLTDSSLEFLPESSPALGNGFRCGFLGLLHAEIIQERLEREHDLELIATVPNVEYEIRRKNKEKIEKIKTPFELPDPAVIDKIKEPWVSLIVFSPKQYLGSIMQLCEGKRAKFLNIEYLGDQVKALYEIPLAELIIDFYDQLKSVSQGYASLDYELIDFRSVEAVKVDILIAGDKVDALSQILVKNQAPKRSREILKRLKDVIPRQQFKIALQTTIGGKIIAREDISAFRKDVTAKLYGGDVTRKKKLLEKQKKGKARMKRFGKVNIPQEAFMAVLKKS